MSEHTLGETFDIHGGGLDLIFPHHENEIAQSVCAHAGRPFARYWLHNGMLTVGGAKMAKSEGNFITVRDALEQGADQVKQGEIIRLALLMTHYRDPLDWTEARLHEAKAILDHWYRALLVGGHSKKKADPSNIDPATIESLYDDLNVPRAIGYINTIVLGINVAHQPNVRQNLQEFLINSAQLLGLLTQDPARWLRGDTSAIEALLRERIDARSLARKERRFAEADRIRAELAAEGIVLEDKPDGTTTWWRKD
jgi:cysteinyl-tRNA synthetase